jgi:hypothetical protein
VGGATFYNDKLHGAVLMTQSYTEAQAKNLTLEDVANELAGISGGNYDENKTAIINAYTEVYDKLCGTSKSTVVNGNTYELVITDAGKVTYCKNGVDKTGDYYWDSYVRFSNHVKDVCADNGVTAAVNPTVITNFILATDPTKLVVPSDGEFYLLTPAQLYAGYDYNTQHVDGYIPEMVEGTLDFLNALNDAGFTDINKLFNDVFIPDAKCNFDNLAAALKPGFLTDRAYAENGSFSFIDFSRTITGAADLLNQSASFLPFANLTDNEAAAAFATILDNSSINLSGTLSLFASAVKETA